MKPVQYFYICLAISRTIDLIQNYETALAPFGVVK